MSAHVLTVSDTNSRATTPRVDAFNGPAAEWDACVRASPEWTHFHSWGWKEVIEGVFGHECIYLAARDAAGGVVGVLPLVHTKSRVFGDYLVSMPFLNYGGPLGSELALQALVAHAAGLAVEQRHDLLELRCRGALPVNLPVSHRKITCLLDLSVGDSEAGWQRLTSNVRRKVRRAQKEGISVSFGLDQVSAFYQVFARHMRDLGTPTLPRRLFTELAERFPEDTWFGCAYYQGRPVAAGCGFQWGGEFELTWVSALQEYHRIYANMLLYWAFIERAANQRLSVFNFGRCTPGGGTHHFKQQWGSRDVALMWYQLAGRRHATPSPRDPEFAWGPSVWKRLPLVVANHLGPAIARVIP
jgi:FemAB-related protein (PEP-CTERM system-associated)